MQYVLASGKSEAGIESNARSVAFGFLVLACREWTPWMVALSVGDSEDTVLSGTGFWCSADERLCRELGHFQVVQRRVRPLFKAWPGGCALRLRTSAPDHDTSMPQEETTTIRARNSMASRSASWF